MASEAVSKAATADTIKQSIESGLSSIKLQPIVRLNNDQDVWHTGNQSPPSPQGMDYLISCAEEAGIIHLITESVPGLMDAMKISTSPSISGSIPAGG